MQPKPVALPRPPRAEMSASVGLESFRSSSALLEDTLSRREALAYELELLDAEVERLAIESICGNTDDTQDVERYDGSLGVPRRFVDDHERPIGQLQWLADLSSRFSGPGESAGNVSNVRWGSGGLFADDLFVTAGHCFDRFGGGWRRPQRNGQTIEPAEIASLMKVNFGYQIDGQTGQLRTATAFPVVELIDYRLGNLDFAIVRLGENNDQKLPGELFGTLNIAPSDLTTPNAMLCMIQHPAGRPKKIEAGPMLRNVGGQIAYDSLDTLGGSSGSPILGPNGNVVGVHTNGGCTSFSGFNYGVAIGAVRAASSVIN